MASQIYDTIGENAYYYRYPNLTYRMGEKLCSGRISGLEAMKQSIYHILRTERYSNPIYSDDYGVELEQYIGKDLGYLKATIEGTLRDALRQDDRVTDVYITDISQNEGDIASCTVEFMVVTIYGEFEESVDVIQ